MDKIKLIKELEGLEYDLINIKKFKEDINNFYTDKISIHGMTDGTNYRKEYNGEEITLDGKLLNNYLGLEQGRIKDRISEIIQKLSKGYDDGTH